MENFLKYFKSIFIIASSIFFICFILCLGYGLKGEVFLKVDNDNKNLIWEMCEIQDISLNGELSQIGYQQGLGDWYLYIYYDDGSSERRLLDAPIGAELRSYLRENGQVGGMKGLIAKYLIKISALIIGIYMVCSFINKFKKKNRK